MVMPEGDLPPASDAIRRIKDREKDLFAHWMYYHDNISAWFKIDKAKAIAECLLTRTVACVAETFLVLWDRDSVQAQLNNRVEELALGLIMNVAKNHGAIWRDPPDADFARLPAVVAPAPELFPAGGPAADAITDLLGPMANEVALTDAYLHAIERYQGAQAAGDAEWALVQARAARDLSATLAEQMGSSTPLNELRAVVADPARNVLANYTAGRQFVRRVQTGGFTGDERRNLINAGLSVQAVNDLEAGVVAIGSVPAYDQASILAPLDQVIAARDAAADALGQSRADWAAVVDRLAATSTAPLPAADAGGPYTGTAGTTLALSASATTSAGTQVTAYEWDLDADGEYDDATGPTPSATFPTDDPRVVAVQVTNDAGRRSVDHANVVLTGGDRAPILTATSPARAVDVVIGTPAAFSVTAEDPAGASLTYLWTLDGDVVGSESSFSYDPAVDDAGHHVLTVDVAGAGGRSTRAAWRATVTTADTDGDGWTSLADCDDARTDVHPGRFELLGNGVDDDCDAGTPDAPPGGLTGAVWSWGTWAGLGFANNFTNVNVPTRVPALPSVTQIDSSQGGGVAVLPSGEVRTWGGQLGVVGDGTQEVRVTPVSPLAVGGAPGSKLSGVVRVSSDANGVIAVRHDSSVIAWGDQRNGQVGDRSDVDTRLYPVEVVTADGTPVTGAVDVEAGGQTNYILMADGTVWTTGVRICNGQYPLQTTDHAVPAPLFGDDVVQIEAGHQWAVARKADGSLWACGSSRPELGRGSKPEIIQQELTPKPMIGFGPTNRAVDVSSGMSTGVALTEDGTVWMWGRNLNGEMNAAGVPHGNPVYQAVPVSLPAGPPVVDVDNDRAGHTIAVRVDGAAVTWGSNNFGAAGTGSFSPNPAVGFHTLAIPGDVVSGAVSVWNSLALVRPLDDPSWERPLQYVGASVADTTVGEATGGIFTLTLSQPAPRAVTFGWSLGDQTGSATIAPGATSAGIPVTVANNDLDEPDHQITFSIETASNGIRLDRRTAVGTVVDDDDPPVASISSATVVEGRTSLTDAVLAVTLSRPSGRDVVLNYSTGDGTASAGSDYVAATGAVIVPARQTTAAVHLAVVGDDAMEPNETFTVTVADPVGATLGQTAGTVSITDDEPVVVTVASPRVTEGDGGTTPATFRVEAAEVAAGSTVSVPWSLAPGTAEIPADLEAASGTVVLTPTATGTSVVARVVADDVAEDLDEERFRLRIGQATASDGRPVVVADPGLATVVDDDAAPVVSAGDDVSGLEGEPIALTATVTYDGPFTVAWSTGTAGCTVAEPAAATTTVTCADDVTAELTVAASAGSQPPVSDSVTVTVGNQVPVVLGSGYEDGAVQVTFSDPGADTHRCTVDPGDGTAPVTVEPSPSPCTVAHPYGAGSYTATVTVVDDDGGSATASVPVTVGSDFAWEGFFEPVDNNAVNDVNAGRTIPLKFSLGGDRGLNVLATGSPASVKVNCTTGAPLGNPEPTATPGNSSLAYDASSRRYHYGWKTEKAWAGQCRLLKLTLADGSEHTATFRFR